MANRMTILWLDTEDEARTYAAQQAAEGQQVSVAYDAERDSWRVTVIGYNKGKRE